MIKTWMVCDMCGLEYKNIFETQEFICIKRRGGYGSTFGDEEKIEVDICQHCFKKLIMDKKIGGNDENTGRD